MQALITGFKTEKKLFQNSRITYMAGVFEESNKPVLVKTINQLYPTVEEIARIKNEYQILSRLDISGVPPAIDLIKHGNRLSLIQEDFGGSPIIEFIDNGIQLTQFFTMAIAAARALEEIHKKNIIHKSINPYNLLWNNDTNSIKIIDFENASELSQEQKNEEFQELNEENLPYISPEQTGRMNRNMDYLTDYYSLGATFYQMLAGQPAFEAQDTMGWIYCHITKRPVEINKTKSEIPKSVSDVVLKLMSKNPENRYQSLQGLIKDLEYCQQQWAENGFVNSFELGKGDFSDKFQIPQRLYGRKIETEAMLGAYQKASRGQPELLLIAGFSGIGKSALVKEIRIPILQNNGYFVEGKNEQLQRSQPYVALTQAFNHLVRRILAEPNEQHEQWRNKLKEALEPNGRIILDIVPELEKIIGPQPPVQDLNPTEAQNRFLITFRKFVQVFAKEEHPLVVFLDDLQWTDVSTLDLISDLLRQKDLHLLVIGAYRNNEVSDTHPLMLALDEIQKFRFIKRLFLRPLEKESVNKLITDTLHQSSEQINALSEMIFSKTNGNPFFMKELLKELHKVGFISFNYNDRSWGFDLDNIRELQVSDNVVHFVIDRIKRLPEETQKILELASCIGSSFDLKTLGVISNKSLPTISSALWDAINEGVLIPLDDRYRLVATQDDANGQEFSDFGVKYKFSHDRIQQAFYSLIHEDKKKEVHLSIGRLMLRNYDSTDIESRLVDILFQLNESRSQIKDHQELLEVARLNLSAGKKAKSSTAYRSAYDYLIIGLECLPAGSWESSYNLTFELYAESSECAYLCGEFSQADEQCKVLLEHAKTRFEKAEVLRMQSVQYTIRGELETAIKIAIDALALLDVKMSPNPSKIGIARELIASKFNLGMKKISDLENQPIVEEPKILASLKILIELGMPAYLLGKEQLFAMSVLKAVNITLKHGNTPYAPMCFIGLGYMLGGVIGDWKSGYEFGKLGLALNEKTQNLEIKSRVIFTFAVFVHSWNRSWRSIPDFLKQAIEAGYQSGDLFYLAYSAVQVVPWDPDLDLVTAIQEGEKYLAVIKESKYEDAWQSARIIQQLRLNFRGSTFERMSLNSMDFDEKAFVERNKRVDFVPGIALYHLYKMQICFSYEDYKNAAFHADEARKPMASMTGLPYTVEYSIYAFLSYVAVYSKNEDEKRLLWKQIKSEYNQMRKWANHCPENFSHHYYLMEAELARLAHKNQSAISYYNKAIAEAQKNGFVRYEALCNELAAKHFLETNQQKISSTYMRDALYCYKRWGASAKSNQLKQDYAQLFSRAELEDQIKEHLIAIDEQLANEGPAASRSNVLDLKTISKASQTLSGEVVLEKLLKKLMYIVRENAGASKVILILKEETSNNLLIQAESVDEESPKVMQSQPLRENENLSVGIVQYVARSLEHVVLQDAVREGDFVHDEYVSRSQPKSVLSLPIINQGMLVGVLYLENNLTTNAFTPDRLEVLGVLSAQAAISIQNAILYRTMEQKVAERTREIKELLDNTGQGFLTFDEDFKVHKQYSKACEQFFGRPLVDRTIEQEKGVDFIELVVEEQKERAQLKKLFEAILTEKVTLEAIVQFFPEEVVISHRTLSLEYKLITASHPSLKNRIMVILTDITREKELAKQLEKDEERNNIILQIVKDRQGYLAFLKSFKTCYRNIEVILKKDPDNIDVDKLFRQFHTIKGGAANFNLNLISDQAHEIESTLYSVRTGEKMLDIDLIFTIKRDAIQLEQDFRTLSVDFGKFIPEEDTVYMETLYKVPQSKIDDHRYQLIETFGNEHLEIIEKSIEKICRQPIKQALRGLEISAQTLAKDLGKRIKIEIQGEQTEILFDRLNHLLSSFIHLVRNAVDHGLESPEERLKTEKPEIGHLLISAEKAEDQLHFAFEDDGRGMDADKLAAIAMENGQVEQQWIENASAIEKLHLVFSPGFSSKTEASQISGRGVGMDVVKTAVDELSGTIELDSELGKGTKIKIVIPDE